MQETLTYIQIITIFVATITGINNLKLLQTPYRLLLMQVFVALEVEVLARTTRQNTQLYNSYILIELVLIMLAGIVFLQPGKLKSAAVWGVSICVLAWGANLLSQGHKVDFSNIAFVTNCVTICILYVILMLQVANTNRNLSKDPLLWLSLANIVYFSGVIPYFSFYKYFRNENRELGSELFKINTTLSIIRNIFITYSFWLMRSHERTQE